MATMPWIKLYTEILDDPKFGLLPDSAFSDFIRLLLLAGKLGNGKLGMMIEELAWRLHKPEKEFRESIACLFEEKLIEEYDGDLICIPDFEERYLDATSRRILRERTQGGGWTEEEWEELKKQYDYHCVACKTQQLYGNLVPDHVVPLALGGAHDISNIQPLCSQCNSKKGAHYIDYRLEWMVREVANDGEAADD